jgi:hypothetical protein
MNPSALSPAFITDFAESFPKHDGGAIEHAGPDSPFDVPDEELDAFVERECEQLLALRSKVH